MELKREYDSADLQRYQAERESAMQEARQQVKVLDIPDELADSFAAKIVDTKNIVQPKITRLCLNHTGFSPEQNFSTDFVTEMLTLGMMEIKGDALTFRVVHDSQDVSLKYKIKRTPGRYCLHCDEKLEGDDSGQMARLHVAMEHAGIDSPDPNVLAGYVWLKHFECVLDKKQHEMFRKAG